MIVDSERMKGVSRIFRLFSKIGGQYPPYTLGLTFGFGIE